MKFEVRTTMTVKGAVLLDVSPCSLVDMYHLFRRICIYVSREPWRWKHTALQDILKVKTMVVFFFFFTFLASILRTEYLLQTYELPEAGRELWPKHVRAIINNNKNTAHYVGNKYFM